MGLERHPEVDLSQIHTSEDMVRYLPAESRYELIAGKLRDRSPAPNLEHGYIAKYLFTELLKVVNLKQILIAPVDLKLDEENVVQPDLMATLSGSFERKGQYVRVVPDLVIEIASPGSPVYDYNYKYRLYEQFGVKEYWVVNPMESTVDVFRLIDNEYKSIASISKEGLAKSEVIPEFNVELKEIFNS